MIGAILSNIASYEINMHFVSHITTRLMNEALRSHVPCMCHIVDRIIEY